MSDDDDEILQDFLVEAGEILEQLSQQLVDLERSPDDTELLNSIFRGFHTVKGGAGFLQLDAMVDICHVAENVFDTLRKGECAVTPELMDAVLITLDVVNTMFDEVRAGDPLSPAAPELINTLAVFAKGGIPESMPVPATVEGSLTASAAGSLSSADVSLPSADGSLPSADGSLPSADGSLPSADGSTTSAVSGNASADMITDAEFEALLDSLTAEGNEDADNQTPIADAIVAELPPKAAGDEITDDEFQRLLDDYDASDKPAVVDSKEVEKDVESSPLVNPTVLGEASPAAIAPKLVNEKKRQENIAGKSKSAPKETAEATVRVDTKRLDDIMNMVGELVLVRNRLVRLGLNIEDEDMGKAVSNLDVVTADLQTAVMKTRMQPIKKVFGRFPRVVRDLARSLQKEINLEMVGEETDLDKNLVEALADPLVHLVRNSVDHGVESPEERVASGKTRAGLIVLSAEQEGDHILLVIKDDGKGMDPDVIREIAVSKGAIDRDAADRLNDSECFNLIFAPGFSTKEEISDVSGRGVGMDVVKTKITQLNGSVDVESKLGEGTRIVIKVPLTLAIMPTLMVMLQNQTFALPLVSVNEIFHLDLNDTNIVDGQEVIIVRNKAIPLYYLKNWLVQSSVQQSANETSDCHVVIVSAGNQRVGFVVDQLIGQEEVVIKPLGKMLHGTAGMAGATITGDGTIALILDVPGMLKRYG
jgi:two-component system chemotaxis sensor kinase CheA